jgi:carboxypeptidase T
MSLTRPCAFALCAGMLLIMSSFTVSFTPIVSSGSVQLPDMDSSTPPETYGGGNNTVYHTYWEMMIEMQNVAFLHPSVAQLSSIGQSWQGRELWVMKISDNVAVDEDEPEVYFNGAHHAREWMTIEINLYFINWITGNYTTNATAQYLVNNREIWVLPLVNPDGREIDGAVPGDDPAVNNMWRKNCRDNDGGGFNMANDGVDLNRNYDWNWGAEPNVYNQQTYAGPYSFSEPETQAVRDFVKSRHFVCSISYHTYSQLIMWPWGWTYEQAPDDTLLKAIGLEISHNITNLAGSSHTGYTPQQSCGLYTTTGDDVDWLYGECGILSYVIEAYPYSSGDGLPDPFHPPATKVVPVCMDNLGGMICIALIADNPNQVMDHITLTPIPEAKLINQQTTDSFTINALNDGKRADTFNISHSNIAGWTITTPTSIFLIKNQSQNFTMNVTVPAGYAGGDYTIWVNATSQTNSSCRYGTSVVVTVPFFHDVALISHSPFVEGGQYPQGNITMSAIAQNRGQVSEPPFNMTCTVYRLGSYTTTTIFSDNFDGTMSKWKLNDHDQGITNNLWHQVTTTPHSSPNCSWCGPPGTTVTSYSNDVIQSMETVSPLNLRGASGANLTFWTRYNMENNYDYGKIMVSGNGGVNWTLMVRYTGDQNTWALRIIDLKNFTGSQNVLIRFFFTSDGGSTAAGWRVDDVSVTADFMSETVVYGPTNMLTQGTLNQNDTQECTWQYGFTPGIYKAVFQTNLSTDERSSNNLKDVVFTINAFTLPYVTVTAPNTAVGWLAGSSQTITWTASAGTNPLVSNPISIYYSTNGPGGPWSLLAINEANDGEFTWIVNNTPSGNCYVRVDAEDNQGYMSSDASDVSFSIILTPMTIWLSSPNGGECLMGGGSWPVTWSAVPGGNPFLANPITLEYSTAGPTGPWSLIVDNEANDGSYTWTPVPSLDAVNCYVRVAAEDTSGTTGSDTSNSSFEIDSVKPLPATNVRAELTGINDVTIYWTASPSADVAYYRVYYIQNGWDYTGDTYVQIAGSGDILATSYTHVSVGNASATEYCYQVRTYDNAGNEARTFIQAAKYSKLISASGTVAWGGWIPLGSFLTQSSYAVSHKLQGQGLGQQGFHNWSAIELYNAWDNVDPWKFNLRNTTSMNEITTINNTQAFWACIYNAVRYTSAGYISNMSIPMNAGWNLVPYPFAARNLNTMQLRDHLIANCPGFGGAYSDMEIMSRSNPYRVTNPIGTEIFTHQDAFWVRVTADTAWNVVNYTP